MKILIVEDNEKNLKLFSVIIKSLGYEILTAMNGEEAVRLAKEHIPALILMDIRTPVMDGITATKIIKSEHTTSKIPVIILTAHAMVGNNERIISESGRDGYITKPIDIKELMDIVGKITQ